MNQRAWTTNLESRRGEIALIKLESKFSLFMVLLLQRVDRLRVEHFAVDAGLDGVSALSPLRSLNTEPNSAVGHRRREFTMGDERYHG